jgi:exodeoxyribonuclease VII large subunit
LKSKAWTSSSVFLAMTFQLQPVEACAVSNALHHGVARPVTETGNYLERAALESGRRVWGVGALLRAIADSVEARFNPVSVSGEVTGFSRAGSGHCYFSVKDDHGQIRCAMFRRTAALLDFSPADGQRVELRGRLGVYDQRGELQLVVESMTRDGEGGLFKLFLALKARLEAEGLFDQARKRTIPAYPKAIGVVTSLGAAALHDVVHALERRAPNIKVIVYPASVQGSHAAGELCAALDTAYLRNEVDVLLVVRGGGNIEDLWAFNDEVLARRIVRAPMPLISGVGHETDFTIADFCADVRAPTPTAAAELCAQSRDVLLENLERTLTRFGRELNRQLDEKSQRLDKAAEQLGRPSHLLARRRAQLASISQIFRQVVRSTLSNGMGRLDILATRLPSLVSANHTHARKRVERAELRMDLLDPKLVLKRGYSWLADMEGVPISSVKTVHAGQPVRATLGDGEVDLTVSARRLI